MDLDNFLKQNLKEIRKNIFTPYKDEILALKAKGATLKIILKWLIMNDEEIKNKYENKENNGIVHLSKTLKKWLKDDNKNLVNKEVKNDLKNDEKITPKEVVKKEKKDIKNNSVDSSDDSKKTDIDKFDFTKTLI